MRRDYGIIIIIIIIIIIAFSYYISFNNITDMCIIFSRVRKIAKSDL